MIKQDILNQQNINYLLKKKKYKYESKMRGAFPFFIRYLIAPTVPQIVPKK
jgi:hypothetical protein